MASERNGDHELTVEGRQIRLSNADKMLFDDDGITKRDLVDYYLEAARQLLPHVQDRPLVMMRYPDGINGQRIVQKNAPEYFPDWISRAEVPKRGGGGTVCHVVSDDAATLAYLANQACIELHVFLSRADSLESPRELVFDLDPPALAIEGVAPFESARVAALRARHLLESELGLTSFVKATGGHGLHVHVPLNGRASFEAVRGFARGVGGLLERRYPNEFTTRQRIQDRGDRLYLDIMRNAYAQTVVAPYGVRARPGAPVATPLSWAEVEEADLAKLRFGLREAVARLRAISESGDPWAGMKDHRQGLTTAQHRLTSLAR